MMKNIKTQIKIFSFGVLIFLNLGTSVHFQKPQNETGTNKCFIVSDIHFDPLFGAHNDTALYRKLTLSSLKEWKKLFENSPLEATVNVGLLGKDANYGLLESALANMKKRLANPSFIVIAGDFVWHGAKPKDSVLKRKSIQFIAQLFKENFPGVTIVPAMGNNDTYGNDYELQDAKFLSDFADVWSPDLPKLAADELKSQSYYSCKKDNLTFLVLNSASLAYGSQYQEQADAQLAWLQTNLSNPENKNVWIISHIPPGLNGYNDKNMWNVDNTQTFINSVLKQAPKVKLEIAGHTHFNEFKIFYDVNQTPVAFMRLAPSICDNHGNNPSFEIAEFNNTSGEVTGETNYYLNLSAIPKDKSAEALEWNDTLGPVSTLHSDNISAAAFSKVIDDVKSDKTWQGLHNYVKFYTVGTNIDSTKTINRSNYLKYLKADSLKAK